LLMSMKLQTLRVIFRTPRRVDVEPPSVAECAAASPRVWQGTADDLEDEVVKIFSSGCPGSQASRCCSRNIFLRVIRTAFILHRYILLLIYSLSSWILSARTCKLVVRRLDRSLFFFTWSTLPSQSKLQSIAINSIAFPGSLCYTSSWIVRSRVASFALFKLICSCPRNLVKNVLTLVDLLRLSHVYKHQLLPIQSKLVAFFFRR
jgi:hypothetical protein